MRFNVIEKEKVYITFSPLKKQPETGGSVKNMSKKRLAFLNRLTPKGATVSGADYLSGESHE